MLRTCFSLLILIILISSCDSSSSSSEGALINFDIQMKEDKVFELDYETAFDQIDGKYKEIDGKGYYTFFNRKNNSLYFYEYESGELFHKVQMSKDGPNAIEYPYYFFDFWVHDFENIFINTIAYYYRIDKNGDVLKRIKSPEGDFFSKKDIAIDGAMAYRDGKLYAGIRALVPEKGDTSWLRAVYDFENESFIKEYVDERLLVPDYEQKAERLREMAKTGGVSTLPTYFTGNDRELYGTSAISDSIYYFQGTEYNEAYFAGNPNVEVTNLEGYFNKTKVETFEGGGISIGPKAIQPAFYTTMLSSPDNKFIYRILIHGTKPRINPETEKEEPEVFAASLVIFNTETKASGYVELPIEELNISYYSSDVFVSRNGIHFPVIEVESETLKAYRVISLGLEENDLNRVNY